MAGIKKVKHEMSTFQWWTDRYAKQEGKKYNPSMGGFEALPPTEEDYKEHLRKEEASEDEPLRYFEDEGDRKVWLYKREFFVVFEAFRNYYEDDEIKLLIFEHYDKERRRFERLKNKFVTSNEEREELKRPRIPEEIRIKVWQRDEGKCVNCGSKENLEYDHIIPVSKGGSNTARNIQLLCQTCNRSKSNTIGG